MVDAFRLRSPLDHLGLRARAGGDADVSGAGVTLSEIPDRGLINIRGDAEDAAFAAAVEKAVRLAPPVDPNTVTGKPTGTRIMWLGPDEWMVITRPGGGPRAFAALWKHLKTDGLHAAVTDTTHARTCIRVAGPRARDVMAKGCALDLHPRVFWPGLAAQTVVAKCAVMMTQTGAGRGGQPTYELYPLRSFATYLWTWLEDAAAEYGLKVE